MDLDIKNRPTWTEVDLDNLAYNFNSVKKFVGSDLKYLAVVKADGYGHGAVVCAQRLEREGVDWFGVALPTEGAELRENGITKRILCLGSFWAGQEPLLLYNHLTPVIYRLEQAAGFNRAAEERGVIAQIHVKIDTGMGRVGVRYDEAAEFARRLRDFPNLHLEGLMTHFAAADDLDETSFTELQIERFEETLRLFRSEGFNPVYRDLANSPASVAHPRSRPNMVRLGGVLYGLGDDVLPKGIDRPELRPVLSLRTRIAHLKKVPAGETLGYGRTYRTERESLIATLPIGYQDGYPRVLSNRARVVTGGRYVPVAGRISMDWTIIDVTGAGKPSVGDEVVLIGEQDGQRVTAEELAAHAGTISYEITCGINRRVHRFYVEGEKERTV